MAQRLGAQRAHGMGRCAMPRAPRPSPLHHRAIKAQINPSTHRFMKEGAQVTGRSDARRKMGYQGEQNGLTKWSGVNLELKSFFR
jgi:hypothetical protein